jgi:hypothetical protein
LELINQAPKYIKQRVKLEQSWRGGISSNGK